MKSIILRRSDFRESATFDWIVESTGCDTTSGREDSKGDELTLYVDSAKYEESDDEYDDEGDSEPDVDEMTEWHDFDPDC